MTPVGRYDPWPLLDPSPVSSHTFPPCTPNLSGFLLRRHLLPYPIKQLEHRHAKAVGNDFQSIDRRIGLTVLYPAQVGLIEAALLTKFDLAQSYVLPQCAYAGTKLLGYLRRWWRRRFHTPNCPSYVLIHINTNSYIWPDKVK